MTDQIKRALTDVREGVAFAPLWLRLGWEQTLSRFRRTLLGPFWLSANLLATSIALSFVLGGLLGSNYRDTFPLTISGILAWSLIGSSLMDAAMLFIVSASTMQMQRLPMTFYVFLHMQKTVINFITQLLTFWVVLLLMRLGSIPTWQLIPAFMICTVNTALFSLIVAIPSTRFRDVGFMIGFVIQVMFFLTPVFWRPSQISPSRRFIADYNPFAHEMEILRQPLLGQSATIDHWIWSIMFTCVLGVIAFILLVAYRKRIMFWL